MTRKTRAQELLDDGYANLEESLSLLAKAQATTPNDLDGNGKPDDLDADFDDLDAAQQESDEGEDEEGEEQGSFDGQNKDQGEEGRDNPEEGGEGEDEDEDDTDGQDAPALAGPTKTLAKADDGFVDAEPILRQLDTTLSEIQSELRGIRSENAALKAHNSTLAKAVTGLAEGTRTMAKAFSGAADEPLRSAHQRAPVRVPTAQPAAKAGAYSDNTLFAKAEQAVADGRLQVLDASVFNTAVTARGAQAALDEYPQIAQALGVIQ